MGLGERWAIRVGRSRAVEALVESGVDEAKAERLVYKRVSDADILAHPEAVVAFGSLGDGKILGVFSNILQWVIDHEDAIKKVVAIIMSVVALFG